MIISNPPFYENEIKSLNEKKNIAHHHSGLLLEELINIIKLNLAPSGDFYLLLPFKRNKEFKEILLKQDLHIKKLILDKTINKAQLFQSNDLWKNNRFRAIRNAY